MEQTRNLLPWVQTPEERALVERNLVDRSKGEVAANIYLNGGYAQPLTGMEKAALACAGITIVGALLTAIRICGG